MPAPLSLPQVERLSLAKQGTSRQRCQRHWLLLSLTLAAPLPAAATEPEQHASLLLRLNHSPQGEIFPILRGEDVLVREEELKKASVSVGALPGRRETIGGQVYLSLRSLAPQVSYELDEEHAQLNLTVPSSLLPLTRVDLQINQRPEQLEQARNPSAFLNYSVSTWNTRVTMVTEAAAGVDELLLSTTASWIAGSRPVRGLSRLTLDKPESMLRFVAGDNPVSSGPLGGGGIVGGLHLSRDFTLDPYFVRIPSIGLMDSAETPSSVDVYVNGTRVGHSQLPPGPFELVNLPLVRGVSEARYVLKDAFGRERELNQHHYVASGLLPQGITAFNLSLGMRREEMATRSFDYGTPAFAGAYRRGLNASLTGGLRLEATPKLASGGANLSIGLPRGELALAAAGSVEAGVLGVAGSATYTYLAQGLGLGASLRSQSPTYATLSLATNRDRPLLDAQAFASVSLSERLRLSGEATGWVLRDAGNSFRASLSGTMQLGSARSISLSAGSTVQRTGVQYDAFLTFNLPLDAHTSSSLTLQHRVGRPATIIAVNRSVPHRTGLGYRLHANLEANPSAEGLLEYQGNYGRYSAGLRWLQGKPSLQTGLTGGLVAVGGKIRASRPIENGFALVRAPGLEGARVFLNNQEVGQTDEQGDALVTNLLPYYGNRLSISDQDIPEGFGVPDLQKNVAPYIRRGAIVQFATRRIRPLRGQLVHEGEAAAPFTVGDLFLQLGGMKLHSPLGASGEFELEGVPPGSYEALVTSQGKVCHAVLEVPTTEERSIELGQVPCLPRSALKP